MILTRHFVFLHVPKTGGTFVRRLLEAHAPADWQVQILSMHPRATDIPPSHRHLPRLALIRNPFAWYVSWYYFLMGNRDRDPLFEELSAGRTRSFGETIRAGFALDRLARTGEGPFSQYLRHFLGDLDRVRLGRMEDLRTVLPQMLGEVVTLPADLEQAIGRRPPVNKGEHRPYREEYDEELRALVERGERLLLQEFAYRW